MKWYFAVNENGLKYAWDQIQVAVASARKNTDLKPICLVDQGGKGDLVLLRVEQLKHYGVTVIEHRASLFEIVKRKQNLQDDTFSGHWLRLDIPQIETDDEFVLYTDIDVMFMSDPILGLPMPGILSCAPEHRQDDRGYFNSGVMVMNLPSLRDARPRLEGHLEANILNMAPHDDQGLLNALFLAHCDWMPNTHNWKPYWGVNKDAIIVHFHGPKQAHVRDLQRGDDPLKFGPEMLEIYQRSPSGYAKYMRDSDAFLAQISG